MDDGPTQTQQTTSSNWKTHACALLSTALGLGFIPGAPGTAGTLLGVGIYALAGTLLPAGQRIVLLGIALLIICAASVPLGVWAEKHWQRKDPGIFVLDEVAGYLLTVLLFSSGSVLLTAVWAFVFFRLFDILKPPPVKRAEKVGGGWGILLDDLVAGIYAAVVLNIIAMLAPSVIGAGAL